MTIQSASEEIVFLEALQLASPEEREAYVNRGCGTDVELRNRVLGLLAAHDASGPLDMPPPGVGNSAAIDQANIECLGTQIGPYKLLKEIGQGGMGVVYMAEQTEPVRRKVALKIIKPEMNSQQVIARFEAERQALSLMDHPNIAKVLEAGTTGTGRPYFVMELVKGSPITQYCDEQKLTPRQRLELFLSVCQAMEHAHQKGIIHRDVKPPNVLVAEYDGCPVAKVIDFGVAKAISQPLTEETMFTGFGQVVGTLGYMSPEQTRVNQLDIDTRSDIYSLGVLLYELLTGSTPHDKQRLRSAALDEMLRIIREEEPPRPSTRLSDSKDSLPSISAQRQTDPAKLTRLVRGDLDWIVMKALEKDRTRRYETASGFAADVKRYLSDEPVEACPPSAMYRLRKFIRKRRAVIGTSALLASIVATLAIVAYQFRMQDQDRRNQQKQLYQSGVASYRAGNHQLAQRQFDSAIRIADSPPHFAIKRLRSLISRQERHVSLDEANRLLHLCESHDDQAEIQFVLGDLLCCEPACLDEGRKLLQEAIGSRRLSLADEAYCLAVLADDIKRCEEFLREAIASEPFHDRANVLLVAVILAQGRSRESAREADRLTLIFRDDRALLCLLDASWRLGGVHEPTGVWSPMFEEKLKELLGAYRPDIGDAPIKGIGDLTFVRQAFVARAIADFIREIPTATSSPGLPLKIFNTRYRAWRSAATTIEIVSSKLGAPPGLVELLQAAFSGRSLSELLSDFTKLAADDDDAFMSQALANLKFAQMAMEYRNMQADQFRNSLLVIEELETRCINGETIAPRSQFEIASRVMRILVVRAYLHDVQVADSNRQLLLRQDVVRILDVGRDDPVFLNAVSDLLMQTFTAAGRTSTEVGKYWDLTLAALVAGDWVERMPESILARRHHLRVLVGSGRKQEARSDADAILALDPKDQDALQFLQQFNTACRTE